MLTSANFRIFLPVLLLLLTTATPSLAAQNSTPQLFPMWDERGKYGYLDASGHVVIRPQFDGALPFTEGLAGVGLSGKWGFIDASGKFVVPLSYHAVAPFADGVAAVTLSGEAPRACGYIERSGKFIIKPQREFTCREFKEGFAVVNVYDEGIGEMLDAYINKDGELAVGSRFALAKPFSEGLALVNDFSKTYFVNKDGQTVIDMRGYAGNETLSDEYVPLDSFSEGLAPVGIKVFHSSGYARYGFIDKRGKASFELPEGMRVEGDFHDGRVPVQQQKTERVKVDLGDEIITMEVAVTLYGYVGKTGRVAIRPRFSEALEFSDGLAVVRIGPPRPSNQRDMAGSAAESHFAGKEGVWACIDRAGHVVIKPCGEPLSSEELKLRFPYTDRGFGLGFVDGLFFSKTRVGDKTVYGYMNKRGKYVWRQPSGANARPPLFWRELMASQN